MAGGNYWYCPICNQKALYDDSDERDGDGDGADVDVDVVHQQCLARERDEREQQIRAQVAESIEAEARRDKNGVSAWLYGWQDGLNDAAAIARGYTHTAQENGNG